jgi:hypothetical protein
MGGVDQRPSRSVASSRTRTKIWPQSRPLAPATRKRRLVSLQLPKQYPNGHPLTCPDTDMIERP